MFLRTLVILFWIISFFVIAPSTVLAFKRIEVDLTHQRLYAYDNERLVFNFPVSTGKRITPTPTGGFWPWIKLRYSTMQGGSKARGDYYSLPIVPYVVYFFNERYPKRLGYAIHGTYWYSNFGHPMSHGCVNLRTSDMAKLYYWIDTVLYDEHGNGSGTMILITGVTPQY